LEVNLLGAFNEDKAMAQLAEILALKCGVSPEKARQIRVAAVLHDIGKRKIPADILNKSCKLTAEEFDVVKTHTTLGAAMLESIQGELGIMARTIARYHHERYDGSGYWGKHLGELPYYVEFVAIADVFTALVCGRPYKQPWPPEDALAYIENQADIQFSAVLVGIFLPLVCNDSRVSAIFDCFRGGGEHSGGY